MWSEGNGCSCKKRASFNTSTILWFVITTKPEVPWKKKFLNRSFNGWLNLNEIWHNEVIMSVQCELSKGNPPLRSENNGAQSEQPRISKTFNCLYFSTSYLKLSTRHVKNLHELIISYSFQLCIRVLFISNSFHKISSWNFCYILEKLQEDREKFQEQIIWKL